MSETASRNQAQEAFLRAGGPMQGIIEAKYANGEWSQNYVFHEYPKMIRLSRGVQDIQCEAQLVVPGRAETITKTWTETREVFDDIIVQSEEEEERVLTGGRTAVQIEAERQDMLNQARARGIAVDPSWGFARLQRELGAAPQADAIKALQQANEEKAARIALLERNAELERRLAELEARFAGKTLVVADERDTLRRQLEALGVDVDLRWGLQRLRDELEAATAPV